MSREPDDPLNPNRPRPPTVDRPKGEIKRMVDHFEQTVGPFLKKAMDIPNSMREFMAYAFIAETGYRAQDCCLVQQDKDGKSRWWFESRLPTEPAAKAHVLALEAEVDYLRKQLRKYMEDSDA